VNIDNIINNNPESDIEIKLSYLYQNKDFPNLLALLINDELNFINFLNKSNKEDISELKKCINNENMKLYICSEREEIQNIALDYFKNTNQIIDGVLNIETNCVELENKTINKILNEQILLIDESLLDSIDICSEFNLTNIPIELNLDNNPCICLKKETNFISNTILASSLMLSFSAFAGEFGDAQRETLKALKEVKEVQEVVNQKKTNIELRTKKFVNNIEHKEVAMIVGAASKVAIDQKVEYKTKLDTSKLGLSELGLGKLDYGVEVRLNGEIRGGISGNNPFLKDSSYELNAIKDKRESKIQLDVRLSFN
jgi:hypothetical protein